MDERRKDERINLDKPCLISHSGNIGEIIDLSLSGLSCWCVQGDFCADVVSRKVDIFCKGGQLWARGLNLQVLASESVAGEYLGGVPVRKCRARFTDLAKEQREQLEHIILDQTMAKSRPDSH